MRDEKGTLCKMGVTTRRVWKDESEGREKQAVGEERAGGGKGGQAGRKVGGESQVSGGERSGGLAGRRRRQVGKEVCRECRKGWVDWRQEDRERSAGKRSQWEGVCKGCVEKKIGVLQRENTRLKARCEEERRKKKQALAEVKRRQRRVGRQKGRKQHAGGESRGEEGKGEEKGAGTEESEDGTEEEEEEEGEGATEGEKEEERSQEEEEEEKGGVGTAEGGDGGQREEEMRTGYEETSQEGHTEEEEQGQRGGERAKEGQGVRERGTQTPRSGEEEGRQQDVEGVTKGVEMVTLDEQGGAGRREEEEEVQETVREVTFGEEELQEVIRECEGQGRVREVVARVVKLVEDTRKEGERRPDSGFGGEVETEDEGEAHWRDRMGAGGETGKGARSKLWREMRDTKTREEEEERRDVVEPVTGMVVDCTLRRGAGGRRGGGDIRGKGERGGGRGGHQGVDGSEEGRGKEGEDRRQEQERRGKLGGDTGGSRGRNNSRGGRVRGIPEVNEELMERQRRGQQGRGYLEVVGDSMVRQLKRSLNETGREAYRRREIGGYPFQERWVDPRGGAQLEEVWRRAACEGRGRQGDVTLVVVGGGNSLERLGPRGVEAEVIRGVEAVETRERVGLVVTGIIPRPSMGEKYEEARREANRRVKEFVEWKARRRGRLMGIRYMEVEGLGVGMCARDGVHLNWEGNERLTGMLWETLGLGYEFEEGTEGRQIIG